MKVTKAQKEALRLLPISITTWGGKPFGGMPSGIKSRSTLSALYKRGLVRVKYVGTTETWFATDAGRRISETQE